MQRLIKVLATSLVDNPDQVEVKEIEGEKALIIELSVASDDMGKVIGKQGKIARAIRALAKAKGIQVSKIAGRFHRTIAEMIIIVLKRLYDDTGLNRVSLSGGVFQNKLLFLLLRQRMVEQGFEVLYHRRVPTNDGGISLGQVYIASEVIRKDVSCHSIQDHKN